MNNLWNPDHYIAACNFAAIAHADQTYKSPIEGQQFTYITHLARVAMEVSLALVESTDDFNADLAIQCALLHDTIEDNEVTWAILAENFGEDLANGVAALSKDLELPKEQRMRDSLKRISLQPKEIWLVKMADRITNLSEPPFHWDNERILAYQQEAQLIHEYLYEASEYLANRLQQRIDDYSQYLTHRLNSSH